jgi:hypothetical protein
MLLHKVEHAIRSLPQSRAGSSTKFHLDVGIGDAVVHQTELIKGRNWLDFAGIPPAMFMAISKEQQFAEKLHAYTLPSHDSSNSWVKTSWTWCYWPVCEQWTSPSSNKRFQRP